MKGVHVADNPVCCHGFWSVLHGEFIEAMTGRLANVQGVIAWNE
jgi:hypothetical protein